MCLSRALIVFVLFYLCLPGQSVAAGLKKVMIMDFKNIEKNESYQYLESSITDAVKKSLKAKFAFRELAPKVWKAKAKKNFFLHEDEFYTKNVALQLGLINNQDIVIGGGYKIRSGKIYTNVHIYDIGKKKLVKEFVIKGYADNRIFASVEKIAQQIAKEIESILPNKDNWEKNQGGSIYANQLALNGGYSTFSFPDNSAQKLQINSGLQPGDFKVLFNFFGEYRRNNFLFARVIGIAGMQYQNGAHSFSAEGHAAKVDATVSIFSGFLGLGYSIPLAPKLTITPSLGLGGSYGTINLDYSQLAVLPVDSTGKSISQQDLTYTSMLAIADVRFGYHMNSTMGLEAGSKYQQVIFQNASSGQLSFYLGVFFKL
ncbi:MAG: hypothetical protein ABUK01_17825 [Leptospirales bacterium]